MVIVGVEDEAIEVEEIEAGKIEEVVLITKETKRLKRLSFIHKITD